MSTAGPPREDDNFPGGGHPPLRPPSLQPQSDLDRIARQIVEDFKEEVINFLPHAEFAAQQSEGTLRASLTVKVAVVKKVRGEEVSLTLEVKSREGMPRPERSYKLDLARGKQLVMI